MKKIFQSHSLLSLLFLSLLWLTACKDKQEEVISGFSYKVDATDFSKVVFTNASVGYTSLSWDFGDGSAASTETDPTHVYASTGSYTVKLTATGKDGTTDVSSQLVAIVDPNAELTKLVGSLNKTWHLLRVANANRWPMEVGPIDKSQVWWAMGRNNDEIAVRSCFINDEYTFGRDGSFKYDTKGDFFKSDLYKDVTWDCQPSTAANMVGATGEDLSAWGDGNFTFVLTNGAKPTLEVIGKGAHIGLEKVATDLEVKVPQNSVKYDIIKLSDDGPVDTLILEVGYKFNATDLNDGGYWRTVLVHYDNPADEPAIPSPLPQADFSGAANGLTLTLTNKSKFASSYLWEFGDGATSSDANPTHNYASAGAYNVKLTATNGLGGASKTQEFTVTAGAMTEADLVGGAWRVRKAENSIFVGSGLGKSDWWATPLNYLDGSSSGANDWSCITNDEFIFTAGGKYEYKTNGDARNDSYMGSPNGCWSDAQVAASGNGAAFGSGIHSFTFTPAASGSRPIITVTNGASGAAFIGFYKGYYGGENKDGANAPNGGNASNRYEVMSYIKANGQETMTISVDISADHNGSGAWSIVLVR